MRHDIIDDASELRGDIGSLIVRTYGQADFPTCEIGESAGYEAALSLFGEANLKIWRKWPAGQILADRSVIVGKVHQSAGWTPCRGCGCQNCPDPFAEHQQATVDFGQMPGAGHDVPRAYANG